MAFWKNDNGLLVWSADRVLNDRFELWEEHKDTYTYPVEGWIWADTEIEARQNLNCYGAKPFPSWQLDEAIARYQPPTPIPTDDKFYSWDEDTLSWIEINP
jgi:hypothetical protein